MSITAASLFKCLSEDIRLSAMLLIRQHRELCVCELMHALEESQPKISRHLSQLRSCGVLSDNRRGQWVYYRLADNLPAWVADVLIAAELAKLDDIQEYTQRLVDMPNRPSCC